MQSQLQSPSVQATVKNALFVYIVSVACYLPHFCSAMLSQIINFVAANRATLFFLLLKSSLNPIVYCWRYREIREIVKNTVKKIFPVTGP